MLTLQLPDGTRLSARKARKLKQAPTARLGCHLSGRCNKRNMQPNTNMGFNIVNEQTGEGASNNKRRFFEEWSKIDEQSMPPNMMRTLDELCKMRLATGTTKQDYIQLLNKFVLSEEQLKQLTK